MVDVSWFGGLINFTIPTYLIIGIILIILGVLMGAFVPNVGKKLGIITFIVGLIMAVGFTLLAEWWKNDIFKITIIIIGTLVLIFFILIWGVPTPTGKKGGRKK